MGFTPCGRDRAFWKRPTVLAPCLLPTSRRFKNQAWPDPRCKHLWRQGITSTAIPTFENTNGVSGPETLAPYVVTWRGENAG